MSQTDATTERWTQENIIDLIRKIRNDLIKDFLDDRYLIEYVRQQFNMQEISAPRMEFIRRALKERLIHPVNVSHYRQLIEQIRATDTASLTAGNEKLFYAEIEDILREQLY